MGLLFRGRSPVTRADFRPRDASADRGAEPPGEDFERDLVALLPRLHRFALALSRARDRAEDLVQATCERALRKRDTYTPGTRFEAWIFMLMRNTYIDQLRRSGSDRQTVDLDDAFDVAGEDGRHKTETRLAMAETARRIMELPQEQREVVVLVCAEDLSYRQAADVLGVPIGTVMSRLARARARLAQDDAAGEAGRATGIGSSA